MSSDASSVSQSPEVAEAEHSKNSQPSASSSPPALPLLPRPSFLTLHRSFLLPSEASSILAAHAYLGKGEVVYGAARQEEDGFLGKKKPKEIDQQLYGAIVQRVVALDGNAAAASAASIPPTTRLTVSILHPGQGFRRTRDGPAYSRQSTSLINLGPSHTVVEVYPHAEPSKEKHVVVVQPGEMLRFDPSMGEAEYSIPSKTRDILPASIVDPSSAPSADKPSSISSTLSLAPSSEREVSLKRGRTTLLWVRQLVHPDQPERIGGGTEAIGSRASKKEKGAKPIKEDGSVEAKKEKVIKSTAIRIPGAAAAATDASTSSSTASTASSSSVDTESAAAALESLHVTSVYDSIASHFSGTRHSPWPRIEEFVRAIEQGKVVRDVGCGNGKYMGLNPGITSSIKGCDNSAKLVEICRGKGYDVAVGDIMQIPFADEEADIVLCIAVLHHISTPLRRQRAASELLRILKPGGRALVSAWALEQDVTSRRAFPGQDVLVPWNVPLRFLPDSVASKEERARVEDVARQTVRRERQERKSQRENGGEEERTADAASAQEEKEDDSSVPTLVDSAGGELVQFQRYCHVYTDGELEALFTGLTKPDGEQEKACEIVERYYDRGNWCVVVRKL